MTSVSIQGDRNTLPLDCQDVNIKGRSDGVYLWQELEGKMKLNRRELFAQTGLLAATARLAAAAPAKGSTSILAKADFPIAESQTYLNCAGGHPTPAATARAMKAYVEFKNTGKIDGKDTDSSTPVPQMFAQVTRSKEVKELFAKLVNAKPTEIAYAQSTMA